MTSLSAALTASIPSPDNASIDIGPLELRAYGLMIALGVIAAVWLFGRRLERNAIAPRDEASAIAIWAVPAGVVGARLYHVVTDWDRFSDDLGKIPQIWKGGLGVPGGIFLGVVVGILVTRRRGLDVPPVVWAAVPALPLAQAIGRWGNWFNQELFGRPTDLPWALEIDPQHRPDGYEQFTTFHPTFLYESLWNLALCALLVVIGRRMLHHRPWRLLASYTLGYGLGRWWIEGLRIDPANEAGGLRLNQWMALVLILGSLAYLALDLARHGRAPGDEPAVASDLAEPGDELVGTDEVAQDTGDGDPGDGEPGHTGPAPG